MKLPRRRFLHLAAGAVALPAVSRIARAQAYPTRPITMIVPFTAGGGIDVTGRVLADRMRRSLGQPVIVENVTGGDGNIATDRAVRARADGYTIEIGIISTHALNSAFYSLSYDVLNDFAPISPIVTFPGVYFGRKTLPAKDLPELIAWLKANPDKASLAVVGTGGLDQIVGAYFQQQTGTRFHFVPYRGGGPAIQDLVAGHVDLRFDPVSGSLAQVRSGQLKAYAVLAKIRVTAAPDVPTTDELGVLGLHVTFWYGLWAPKGTPKPIIDKLSAAVAEAFNDPAVQRQIAELGAEAPPPELRTAEAFGAFHKAEVEKWWPFIKATNVKLE